MTGGGRGRRPAVPRGTAATVADAAVGYRSHTLPGGARVLVAPMRERASVAVAVMIAAGSRHEDEEHSGLAHFIEHMVFKGSARYPTSRDIAAAIEGVGGSLNAATDKELTVYWARVPAEHLRLAVDVLGDMVFAPRFEATEVEKERLVVVEELRMYQDNPQEHVHTLFEEVMWPGHPLGRDTAGREETVVRFTRDDCLAYVGEHYRAPGLVVSVAGAVDPDEALAAVAPVLSGVAPAVPTAAEPPPPPGPPGEVRLLRRRTEQANIVVGARAASYLDADRFAVDVLTTVLGEGMSSRLFLELREARGLAYDVHAFTTKHRDSGALAIYVGCEPRRALAAVQAAVAELRRLAEEPVADAELRRAREYTKGRLRLQLEGTSAVCSFVGQQELLTGEILLPRDIVARIDAVSAAEVRAAAQRIVGNGLRGAIIGPVGGLERFSAALRDG